MMYDLGLARDYTFFITHVPAVCRRPKEARIRYNAVETIQRVVAEHYGIPVDEMRSNRRNRKVAWPRQEAMYFARFMTRHSLPAIGRYFGDRDHTTVIHAIKAVERRMNRFAEVDSGIEALRGKLMA